MKELLNKILKNKIGIIIIIIVVIIGVCLFLYNGKESVDTKYLIAQLEKSSELTTAKLTYKGITKYEDKGIAIINKSNFLMVYTATARAGINISDVDIDVDNIAKVVWVKVPKATILDVKVEQNDIEYFDEKFALFNFNSKEDANKAVALAEEKAKEEIAKMGILEMADAQSSALLKGLIQDLVPKGYEIKIK